MRSTKRWMCLLICVLMITGIMTPAFAAETEIKEIDVSTKISNVEAEGDGWFYFVDTLGDSFVCRIQSEKAIDIRDITQLDYVEWVTDYSVDQILYYNGLLYISRGNEIRSLDPQTNEDKRLLVSSDNIIRFVVAGEVLFYQCNETITEFDLKTKSILPFVDELLLQSVCPKDGYSTKANLADNNSTRQAIYNASGSTFTTDSALASKLDNVFNGNVALFTNGSWKYKLGDSLDNNQAYVVANALTGWQCYIYGNAVYYYLFGDIPFHGYGLSGYFSNSKTIIPANRSSVSYEALSSNKIGVGAYLRTTSNADGSYNSGDGHSLIILSYDITYITFLEGNADDHGLIRITKLTWSEFNQNLLSGKGWKVSHIVQPNSTLGSIAAPQVTITFNANGGSCPTGSKTITAGSAIGELPEPTRSGYEFAGWFVEASYGSDNAVSSSSTFSYNTTLYAMWAKSPYSGYHVSFDCQGGTISGSIKSTHTIDAYNSFRYAGYLNIFNCSGETVHTNCYGNEVSVNASGKVVAKRGYGDENFLTVPSGGFIVSGHCDSSSNANDFVAEINLGEYVSYNTTTGKVNVYSTQDRYLQDNKYVARNSEYGVLPTPTRAGKTFVGWYTDAAGGMKKTASSIVTEFSDHTLYAQWSVNLKSDFYAYFVKNDCWKFIEVADHNYMVQIALNGNDFFDPKQVWHFVRQSDGTYMIGNEYNGEYLWLGGSAEGYPIKTFPFDNVTYHKCWKIDYSKNAYSLTNSDDLSRTIGVEGNKNDPGTILQAFQTDIGGTEAQVFNIYDLENIGIEYSKPDKPQQTEISVNSVGYAGDETSFSWTPCEVSENPFDDCHFDLCFWTGENYSHRYKMVSGLSGTNYSIALPEGAYRVSIDSVNIKYYNWITPGNEVYFTVEKNPCADGHDFIYSVTTEPTLSTDGVITGTCSRCSASTTTFLPKLNTTDYTYTVTKEATCTATGTGRYTWKTTTYGTFYFDVTLPKTAHNYQTTVTPPTCTAQGYTTHTCSVCGDTYKDSYTDALGHAWDNGVVTKPATETEPGIKLYTCTRCGDTKTETIPATGLVNPFVDVKEGDFFYDAVLWAFYHDPQITAGTSKTKFSPSNTCTREQVVTFLWRAKGCEEPTSTENPFKDVPADAYYTKAVLWAVEKGVTNGTSKTKFGVGDPCTREQVVTFLWRAEGMPEHETVENPFTDVSETAYSYHAILWAVENGITNGTSKTKFSPAKTCTRGQIVTFLYRYMV